MDINNLFTTNFGQNTFKKVRFKEQIETNPVYEKFYAYDYYLKSSGKRPSDYYRKKKNYKPQICSSNNCFQGSNRQTSYEWITVIPNFVHNHNSSVSYGSYIYEKTRQPVRHFYRRNMTNRSLPSVHTSHNVSPSISANSSPSSNQSISQYISDYIRSTSRPTHHSPSSSLKASRSLSSKTGSKNRLSVTKRSTSRATEVTSKLSRLSSVKTSASLSSKTSRSVSRSVSPQIKQRVVSPIDSSKTSPPVSLKPSLSNISHKTSPKLN